MASPQVENGYIKIANEFMGALCQTNIPGEARRIFDLIMRETWGYNVKAVKISFNKMAELSLMPRRQVQRAVKALLCCNMVKLVTDLSSTDLSLSVKSEDNRSQVYKINKNYSEWSKCRVGDKSAAEVGVKSAAEKKSLPLDKKQKDKKKKKTPPKRSADFHSFFWPIYPVKKGKQGAFKKWESLAKSGTLPPTEEILKAIRLQIEEKKHLKATNQFCPEWKHPTTWLNNGCWDDEVTVEKNPNDNAPRQKIRTEADVHELFD